jgi:hypothetical protein
MQVPALEDGGTELGWRLTFLFVILKQPCGAKRIFVTKRAKISQVIIGATRVLATSCAGFTDLW